MPLDREAARTAIAPRRRRAARASTLEEAAAAILDLATEKMVARDRGDHRQPGHRPARGAVLVGGGGGAGLNTRGDRAPARLRARCVIPEAGAALSAAGALMSDLTRRRVSRIS